MSSIKHTLFIILLAFVSSSAVFSQTKNNFSYQSGILNHFYDESPVFFNSRSFKNTSQIRGYLNSALIRSRSLNYTRSIGKKSNISLFFGFFRAHFDQGDNFENNPRITVVNRNWRFFGFEYNQLIISKNRFNFYGGGGMMYKKGYEVYQLNNYGYYWCLTGDYNYSAVQSLGATVNLNMKFRINNFLFFSTKIDAQYYGLEIEKAKVYFTEMQNEFSGPNFPKTKKLNHTLTLGFGIDF
ncbi:MAG: hypothetical protein AB8B72_07770 [Crocinitomicaceae bacterium]